MLFKVKKGISELIDTLSEMLGVLCQLKSPISAVSNCLEAVEAIHLQLIQEEIAPNKTIGHLHMVKESLHSLINDNTNITQDYIAMVNDQLLLLKAVFQDEVRAKLNVVFFPYKASMWDSLSTVYKASVRDKDCFVKVVPIPYYELTNDKAVPVYEGDHFPNDLPITHYSKYNLEEEQPDIIFVHNIYDEYNTLTRVFEQYFTSNLKKYTDMLVFIPYHVSSFIPPQKGNRCLAYDLPTIKNVDKIILAGDFLKKAAICDGVPEEKILALGSPKLDEMVKAIKQDITFPAGWKEKLQDKTVYLLNTGCMFWSDPFSGLGILTDLFNITRFVENSVFIWRPHPLTKISIKKYVPYFYNYYDVLTRNLKKGGFKLFENIILDETDDYLPALKAADVLISTEGSLLRSYLLTEKKVIYLDKEMPKGSLIPSNAFYYYYNEKQPWYETVKEFAQGSDPLAENRKGIASKVYANTDGTCGEKVYQAIKECVLKQG